MGGGSDRPIDEAPCEEGTEPPSELDLVFCIDSTGSMGSYIFEVQRSVQDIVTKIQLEEKCDVKFALIAYRDHPPQDHTFVTKIFPFTKDVEEMKKNVQCLSAAGGGDGPEALTAALYEVSKLRFRPNAAKVVVLIADAPPHGLEPRGDEIPNGDPDGHDPLVIARELAAHGVTIYPVGCEPALGNYMFARDFMCNLAEVTQGQAIPLSSAKLLPHVILGGAEEEIALEKLSREVDQELKKPEYRDLGEEELVGAMHKVMQSKGHRTKQLKRDGMWNMSPAACKTYSTAESLRSVKAELCKNITMTVSTPASAELSEVHAFERDADERFHRKKDKRKLKKKAAPMGFSKLSSWFGGSGGWSRSTPALHSDAVMEDEELEAEGSRLPPAPAVASVAAPCTYAYVEEDEISAQQIKRLVAKNKCKV